MYRRRGASIETPVRRPSAVDLAQAKLVDVKDIGNLDLFRGDPEKWPDAFLLRWRIKPSGGLDENGTRERDRDPRGE